MSQKIKINPQKISSSSCYVTFTLEIFIVKTLNLYRSLADEMRSFSQYLLTFYLINFLFCLLLYVTRWINVNMMWRCKEQQYWMSSFFNFQEYHVLCCSTLIIHISWITDFMLCCFLLSILFFFPSSNDDNKEKKEKESFIHS